MTRAEHARPMRFRRPRRWALLTLGLALGFAAVTVTRLPTLALWPIAAGWLWLAHRLRWGDDAAASMPRRRWPWSLLPLILWGIYVYLADSFGKVDLGAVFFHLQAGISDHGGGERLVAAVLYTLAMLAVLAAFTWLVRRDDRWARHERLLAAVLLLGNPMLLGLGQRGMALVTEDGAWLDRRYVAPVIQAAPADPPNLLVLYLESLERTYADRDRFGDAYAPLAELGERGVVFEGVRQLDNTGWTMAGMIASQCGTPLMPAGLLHDSQFEPLERVVPGVDCLGDLLQEQGYALSYLGGASTRFAGKGRFYTGHGVTRVRGRETLSPRLEDPDYLNSWGLYDDSLYDFTLEEIRRREAEGGPWGVIALSLGTHPPAGYPARACEARQGEHDGEDILYAVECSAWLARRLVERLEAEGLLDNTLVVLASDHLTMRVSAWDELIAGPRANTFMLLHNDLIPRRLDREGSTLDVLPTVLEAMGFRVENHHAGLGVSLLSREPTLVERHGLEAINARMQEETALQRRLWKGLDLPRPEPASVRAEHSDQEPRALPEKSASEG